MRRREQTIMQESRMPSCTVRHGPLWDAAEDEEIRQSQSHQRRWNETYCACWAKKGRCCKMVYISTHLDAFNGQGPDSRGSRLQSIWHRLTYTDRRNLAATGSGTDLEFFYFFSLYLLLKGTASFAFTLLLGLK